MRDIAKLLFGDDTGRLLGLPGGSDGDGSGMADRARYAEMNGYQVDQDLLALLRQQRVPG